jgi:hypothetical protein
MNQTSKTKNEAALSGGLVNVFDDRQRPTRCLVRQKGRSVNDGDDRASKNQEKSSAVSLSHTRQRILKTVSLIPVSVERIAGRGFAILRAIDGWLVPILLLNLSCPYRD